MALKDKKFMALEYGSSISQAQPFGGFHLLIKITLHNDRLPDVSKTETIALKTEI